MEIFFHPAVRYAIPLRRAKRPLQYGVEPYPGVREMNATAPAARTWVFVSGVMSAASARVPYRPAPRPSMDASPISAHYEAYAS